MNLTANKGEWSEFYAFLKLLSTGELYAANENAERFDGVYSEILKIFRSEADGNDREYIIESGNDSIKVCWHHNVMKTISRDDLSSMAEHLYRKILEGGARAFEIDKSNEFMRDVACTKIVAPSTDKTDITLQFHDIHTGYNPICGFSIKSELGSPPTLLNASGATNFVYEVNGLTDEQMEEINSINTKCKIIDRIQAILQHGNIKFSYANDAFCGNLMFIDSHMVTIIADILLDYYTSNIGECKTLVSRLEEKNPFTYPRQGIYQYKFKKFLCSVALGMTPSKNWNGQEEANGGYIIVKKDGDVVAYHIYNRDAFETYLLNQTKLEKGSTQKHQFAMLYKADDEKMYINLNLQIRFK